VIEGGGGAAEKRMASAVEDGVRDEEGKMRHKTETPIFITLLHTYSLSQRYVCVSLSILQLT
jgi:hypothetical protein